MPRLLECRGHEGDAANDGALEDALGEAANPESVLQDDHKMRSVEPRRKRFESRLEVEGLDRDQDDGVGRRTLHLRVDAHRVEPRTGGADAQPPLGANGLRMWRSGDEVDVGVTGKQRAENTPQRAGPIHVDGAPHDASSSRLSSQ